MTMNHSTYKRPWGLVVAHAISSVVLYPLCYYVLRYRRKTVRHNLSLCLPHYSEQQRREIERSFYRRFADMIVETICGWHMSPEVMLRHLQTEGMEPLMADTKRYGGSLVTLGHFFNWEWVSDYGNQFAPYGVIGSGAYKQLTSPFFDRLMLRIREKRGGLLVEHMSLLRTMVRLRKEATPTCFIMIADQRPEGHSAYQDVTLLGQETKMLTGSETLAAKFGYPVYYARMSSPKRGFYRVELIRIYDPETDKDLPMGTVTERYTRLLETNIQDYPDGWLWTHNRFWADPVFAQRAQK